MPATRARMFHATEIRRHDPERTEMLLHHVADWTKAYSVAPYVPDGASYPERWAADAAAFRAALDAQGRCRLDIRYGENPRQIMDLFIPLAAPKGLMVFVHGGFWKAFDKSSWSHLATGALARGFAVAMPSYRLCPEVRISDIVTDIGEAITHSAGLVDGPIFLSGHSAGGHLVTRMLSQPSPLGQATRSRIRRCLSIAGLHDLRPLMQAEMNGILRLDLAEAEAHSPALLFPVPNVELVAWAGSAERAEFLRQNALLPMMWCGLGARAASHVDPDRHHFDVIDGLLDHNGGMLEALLGATVPN